MTPSTRSRSLTLVLLAALLGGSNVHARPLAAPPQCQPGSITLPGGCDLDAGDEACVYRDEWGIPHIVARKETHAWYALGYESARDALYQVQVNLRFQTGTYAELAGPGKDLGLMGGNVLNDYASWVLGTNLGRRTNGSEAALQEILRIDTMPPGMEYRFFENLKAYAQGLEDYRLRLVAQVPVPPLTCQEQELKAWLQDPSRAWALGSPIDVFQVASYGPHLPSTGAFAVATLSDAALLQSDSACASGALPGAGGPGALQEFLKTLPGMGSNGMAWTHAFLEEGGVGYSGVAGDPHGGISAFAYGGETAAPLGPVDTVWFAHVVVDPAPGDPLELPMDFFGHMHHGSGVFYFGHNRDVGWGGSALALNLADTFLLRLEADPEDPTDFEEKYYDYYVQDYVPFPSPEVASIPVKGLPAPVEISYWRLQGQGGNPGFGVVTDADPCTPGVDPWYALSETAAHLHAFSFTQNPADDWLIGSQNPLLKDLSSIPPEDRDDWVPVVFANRTPADPSVDGYQSPTDRNPHDRMAVGLYQLMRATSALEMQAGIASGELHYLVDVCAADREGRVFATAAGLIPVRGEDDEIGLREYVDKAGNDFPMTSWFKWNLYEKTALFPPVPARWDSDRIFDYRFDAGGALRYLAPVGKGANATGVPNEGYLPYVRFDPVENRMHPTPKSVGPDDYENLGFVTASNAFAHHFTKKRVEMVLSTSVPAQHPFPELLDAVDNAVFTQTALAGTHYYSTLRGLVAAEKNQRMIDDWLDVQFDPLTPPMTVDGAIDFMNGGPNYVAEDYPGYWDGTAVQPPQGGVEQYPVPVRILAELEAASYVTGGVLDRAEDEAHFFQDLWTTLHSGAWSIDKQNPGQAGLTDLKDVWIDNETDCFRYVDDGMGGVVPEDFAMPAHLGLIDFDWREIRLGGKDLEDWVAAGDFATVLPQAEVAALIADLETWNGDPTFDDTIDSKEAQLLYQYRLGWNAALNGALPGGGIDVFQEGRMWVPIFTNLGGGPQVFVGEERWPEPSLITPVPYDLNGDLPVAFDEHDQVVGGSQYLMNLLEPYDVLGGLVFPDEPWSSALWEGVPGPGGPTGLPVAPWIATHPVPPYDALYSDPDQRTVKLVTELTAGDVNAIVDFFLALGGFTIVDQVSTKVEAFQTFWADPFGEEPPYARATYPLTRNLVRVVLLQRLLETSAFVATLPGMAGTTWGELVRARVIDPEGTQRWPLDTSGTPIPDGAPVDGGFKGKGPDLPGPWNPQALVAAREKGFQQRVWSLGGSYGPILALFPDDGGAPLSFFWTAPGVRSGVFSSPLFVKATEVFAANGMADTHYADFTDPQTWHDTDTDPDLDLPPTPYAVNQP